MRKLLYILVASLVASLVVSCKTTTKVVTLHDTIAIEVARVEHVFTHDTVTIDSTKEQIVTVVRYDTIGRPYEVTKVEYRNKYITEQGATQTVMKHDTIYVSQGTSVKEQTKQPKRSNIPAILLACIVGGIVIYIGYNYYKFNYRR